MLTALHIENIAVIKTLDVDFEGGFTVLTGETGAGKSIIIDSLNLLMGNRADKELIRNGEEKALVSAVFSCIPKRACDYLSENGIEVSNDEIMISRLVSVSASTAKICGRTVTLSVLKELSAHLFNIHGQNDNQMLLDTKNHIKIIDTLVNDSALSERYYTAYRKVCTTRAEISGIKKDAKESLRLCEILKFQIAEIDSAKLKPGEEEVLATEAKRLRNAEVISSNLGVAKRAMRGGNNGIGALYLADRAAAALSAISEHVSGAAELAMRLEQIHFELEDIVDCIDDINGSSDENPTERLDKIEARLDTITKLQKKYGTDTSEILAFRDDAKKRLSGIENSDALLEDLEIRLCEEEREAMEIGAELGKKRRIAAERLTEEVKGALVFLDMPKVRFSVSVRDEGELMQTGTDTVEFLISTNPGEPLLAMEKIASGGELARIMLSLKSVLNEAEDTGTVVFDEIDTGISGKTSRKVGIKLKSIAKNTQVICVTHSAQIASLAENHFLISKNESDGRAFTALMLLNTEERIDEIARILGGIEITVAQKIAAHEMISEGAEL